MGIKTGELPSQMSYSHYNGLVAKWGVELAGWTEDEIINPGAIQAAGALKRLLDALHKGHCYWRVLTKEQWDEKIDEVDGAATKSRKRRCDFGTKKAPKKARVTQEAGDNSDDGEEEDERQDLGEMSQEESDA